MSGRMGEPGTEVILGGSVDTTFDERALAALRIEQAAIRVLAPPEAIEEALGALGLV